MKTSLDFFSSFPILLLYQNIYSINHVLFNILPPRKGCNFFIQISLFNRIRVKGHVVLQISFRTLSRIVSYSSLNNKIIGILMPVSLTNEWTLLHHFSNYLSGNHARQKKASYGEEKRQIFCHQITFCLCYSFHLELLPSVCFGMSKSHTFSKLELLLLSLKVLTPVNI